MNATALALSPRQNKQLFTLLLQGTSETVRLCFLKFALSFLVVGDNEVIRAILQLKGMCIHSLRVNWVPCHEIK